MEQQWNRVEQEWNSDPSPIQTAHQRNAQSQRQGNFQRFHALIQEQAAVVPQEIVGGIVDARPRHQREDAFQNM